MEQNDYADHPFWQELERARRYLGGLPKDAKGSAFARLRDAIAYFDSFRADRGRLISRTMLDSAYSLWQPVLGSILNADSTRDLSHLEQANQNLDPVLNEVGRWPRPIMRETSADLKVRLDEILSMMEDRSRMMERELLSQETEWRSKLATLGELATGLESATTAQEDRLARIQTALESQNQTIADTAARQLADFSKAQIQQDSEVRARLEAINQESAARLEQESSRFADAREQARDVLASMEDLLGKTEKLAGDTSSAVLARDYGSYSQREFWSGVAFIAVGIAALGAAVFFLMAALGLIGPDQPASWQWVTLKLSVTATAAGGASVLIAVGNRFLKNAAINKRVELELRAIVPFLADLTNDEDRQQAKLAFLDRTFGHAFEAGVPSDGDDWVNISATTKLLTAVVGLVNKPG